MLMLKLCLFIVMCFVLIPFLAISTFVEVLGISYFPSMVMGAILDITIDLIFS